MRLPGHLATMWAMSLQGSAQQGVNQDATAPKYQPLVIVLTAVAAGIVADRLLGWPLGAWWLLAVAVWAVWLGIWRRRHTGLASGFLLLAVACSFAAWHHACWCLYDVDDLGNFTGRSAGPACVEALVTRGPRRLPAPEFDPMRPMTAGERTRIEIRVTAIRDGAQWRRAAGKARVNVDGHLLGVAAGDRVRIFAQLSGMQRPHNPGQFDYADYARGQRRRSQLGAAFPDCITVLDDRAILASTPGCWLDRIRAAGDRILWRYLDHRRSSLAAAVLLGAREELTPGESQAFVESGAAHLLACFA